MLNVTHRKTRALKDFITNLLYFLQFFSHAMAYDAMSIKFDFVSIWLSVDEYIEYIFQEK